MIRLINTIFVGSRVSCRFSSHKISAEQQSYYESRKHVLDSHHYPHYRPTLSFPQFHTKYSSRHNTQEGGNQAEKIAGRVSSIRKHGKTTFIDLREQHLKLQVAIKTEKQLQIRRGDIIGVTGVAFVTKKGQLSVNCLNHQDLVILAPCMWMLPEYESLKDQQTRYRNKCLDLISNHTSMQILKKRSKIMGSLRRQLQEQQYMEVETPTLATTCGGALAKPFNTYHNDHKMDLFLRIAPELYLKKLLIGGINRVYEIGKNFRNESIDQTHNPEFTTCELYCAYEDYEGMAKFTYNLINRIAQDTNGSSLIKGEDGTSIDLSQPWKQVDFMGGLEEALKMKLPIDFDNPSTVKFYDDLCVSNHIQCDEPRDIERLLDKLAGRYLETSLQPFMIKNHPRVMSPLAKPIPDRPHLTQRFELFINGWEIVNSYTELNDPRVQRQNTPNETDFIQSLEYGLVPCAGWGIGLDRLVMLLSETERIQEVISFPLLKSES